jgi:hypothetical protein
MRNEINLKDVFQASQTPNSPIALKCHTYLCSASINKIDHLLRSLLGYSKRESKDWTPKRLARCLDYIYIHGIKFHLERNLQLASFKACFRWAVDMFSKVNHDMEDPQTVQISHQILYAVKFTCGVMEALGNQLPNAHITSSIVSDLINRQGVKGLLSWSQSNYRSISSYALRALAAQKHRLAKEIAASNGIAILSKKLVNIPALLNILSLKPPVTDAAERESELSQCMVVCAMIDDVIKLKGTSEELTKFLDSDIFQQLVSTWCSVCHFFHSLTNGSFTKKPDVVFKHQQLLIYSFTSMIEKCTATSNNASNMINRDAAKKKWYPLMILLMRRWILYSCGQQADGPPIDLDNSILIKLFFITLGLAKVTPTDTDPSDEGSELWDSMSEDEESNTDKLLRDLTNFLMAYVLQPVSNDTINYIGSKELMSDYQLLEKDKDAYQFDSEKIKRDQGVLASYLDVYLYYFRQASPNVVKMVASRMANCLKAIAIVLSDADQLETSPLKSRLRSLSMRFMREPNAIDAFATSSTKISSFLWDPMINQVKQGLVAAANISTDSELTDENMVLINKSRSNLASLRNIAYRNRGLEALLKCDLLQLIDPSFIPSGEVMQKSTQLLGFYALFGQLIAAMCTSALIRRRLGDEYGLSPLIIKLIQEAISLKEKRRDLIQGEEYKQQKEVKQDPIFNGCINLISCCLQVVGSFQYIDYSVTMWFSYGNLNKVQDEDVTMSDQDILPTTADRSTSTTEKLSILPSLLSILLPWRNKEDDIRFSDVMYYIDTDLQVMLLVSQLLEIFTSMDRFFSRQLMADNTALSHLGLLMVCLRSVRYGRGEMSYKYGPSFPVTGTSKSYQPYVIEQLPETPYKIFDENYGEYAEREEWCDNHEYELMEHEEPFENTPTVRCAEKIGNSIIHLLKNDKQYTVMSDPFTSFFEFFMQHLITGTSQEYWRRSICSALYNSVDDYLKLYTFSKDTDHAIKLHEMSAVAVGYAAIGATSGQQWNEALGLTVLSECMISTPHVFGTLCQMLVYELEYEDDSTKDQGKSLLKTITPLRRHAAAQAVEALAFSFEKTWRLETLASIKQKPLPKRIDLTDPPQIVEFVTDDAEPNCFISGDRQLLGACSPIFEALLSGDYAESKLSAIPIHDVTFHGLELFIKTIHQLNEKAEVTKQAQQVTQSDIQNYTFLDNLSGWDDIIDLLQISDRFASTVVKDFCQNWVLNKIKNMHLVGNERKTYLKGLLRLYRHCRDPIETDGGIRSNTWPFAAVLYEALKTITQYMKEASKTKEFTRMIQDQNAEELDAFCNGIAFLLQRKD